MAGLVGTAFRPAQLALTPSLVDEPDELTAANGVASTIESLAFFVGPALAGLLLGVADVATVILLNAVTFVWSAVLVAGVHPRSEVGGGRRCGAMAEEPLPTAAGPSRTSRSSGPRLPASA